MNDHTPIRGNSPDFPQAKPLADIQRDAVNLHALAQGVAILNDEAQSDCSPASNSLHVLIDVLVAKADALAVDLDRLNRRA